MSARLQLGFLVSHNGSSMRAILRAIENRELPADARVVIGNNREAPALASAREAGVATRHISATSEGGADNADHAIAATLIDHGVEYVITSGYLRKLGPHTLAAYRNRILNIHPALLPKFGGRGMFGMNVHRAVIAAGEAVSGASVHLVDAEYDQGPVLAQRNVPVLPDDDAASLAARVEAIEPVVYIDTLRSIADGTLVLPTAPR